MNMKIIAVAFVLLLAAVPIGFCAQGPLKIVSADGNDSSSLGPRKLAVANDSTVISLYDASMRSLSNSSGNESGMGSEDIENKDFIRNEVSAGNVLFVRNIFDGVFNDTHGPSESRVFTALTYVPNPYNDKGIVELYGGYQNLILYVTVLFVLGALTGRSIARTKLYEGKVNLSQSAFVGGIAMCCLALVANILYAGALELIGALNHFIALPALPEITPNPDNLLLFVIKSACDLLLLCFFVIRCYIIYGVAIACSIVIVLLVPEFTRDFATDCIEKIVRILALQPAALFVYVVCLIASEGLPEILKPFSYIGMTVLVAATCWYFLFGDFTLVKKGVSFAIRKGVVKV